jgi:DNA repair protein SbcD/Mre11
MKFMHLSDLHIGKRVNEFSMLEDQEYILREILDIAAEQKPDAVLLAGDLYDRCVPPGEAVELLDEFLTRLAERSLPVFAVSGNHDSPERLDFGTRIMQKHGVTIAGSFRGRPQKSVLSDAYGPVNIWLLPFLKPAIVSPFFPEEQISSYEEAVRHAIAAAGIDPSERNVLVAHQFVTAFGSQPETCESETLSVGGADQVDASVFDSFDYVALGHLHGPQRIGRPEVRYAGSPLKYSFSEMRQKKSVTFVELKEKGCVEISTVPLVPLREMREIRGPIAELTKEENILPGQKNDYIRAVLTDDHAVAEAAERLRAVYPNLMCISFEGPRSGQVGPSRTAASGNVTIRTPQDLFAEFYQNQNGRELPENERPVLDKAVEAARGEVEA